MRRPSWWPRGWAWPGGEPSTRAGRLPDPAPGGRAGARDATFLTTLLEAFGAERAALLSLDRERGAWRVERSATGPEARPAEEAELPAPGHPLTWCLREDLVVQVPVDELTPDRSGDGWALAGPVPGTSRVLVVVFHGAPPARARRAMRSALAHLAGLDGESGSSPPASPAAGA